MRRKNNTKRKGGMFSSCGALCRARRARNAATAAAEPRSGSPATSARGRMAPPGNVSARRDRAASLPRNAENLAFLPAPQAYVPGDTLAGPSYDLLSVLRAQREEEEKRQAVQRANAYQARILANGEARQRANNANHEAYQQQQLAREATNAPRRAAYAAAAEDERIAGIPLQYARTAHAARAAMEAAQAAYDREALAIGDLHNRADQVGLRLRNAAPTRLNNALTTRSLASSYNGNLARLRAKLQAASAAYEEAAAAARSHSAPGFGGRRRNKTSRLSRH